MMRRNVLSLIVFTVLVASAPVASYAQQAYQFGKCEVAPANKEAALRALHITMPDGVKIAADVILPRDLPAEATSVSNHPAVKAVIPRFSDFDIYKQLIMPGGLFNDFDYSFRRYANNAARSSAAIKPRSMTSPLDEIIGGKLGGGFNRATRATRRKNA